MSTPVCQLETAVGPRLTTSTKRPNASQPKWPSERWPTSGKESFTDVGLSGECYDEDRYIARLEATGSPLFKLLSEQA